MTDIGVDALDRLADALPTSDKQKQMKLNADLLPDGRKVADLTNAEFARALKRLDVEGASVSNTKAANEAVYAAFLQGISEIAVLFWFLENEHRSKPGDDNDSEDDR